MEAWGEGHKMDWLWKLHAAFFLDAPRPYLERAGDAQFCRQTGVEDECRRSTEAEEAVAASHPRNASRLGAKASSAPREPHASGHGTSWRFLRGANSRPHMQRERACPRPTSRREGTCGSREHATEFVQRLCYQRASGKVCDRECLGRWAVVLGRKKCQCACTSQKPLSPTVEGKREFRRAAWMLRA